MQDLINKFKQYWSQIACALLMGLFVIAPYIFFINYAGSEYKGLYMLATDAEPHYLARISDFAEGNGIGNPFIREYKDNVPAASFSYEEAIMSLPLKIFPITVLQLNLIYKFLFSFFISLLISSLFYRFTKSNVWSCTAAVFIMTGYNLVNIPDIINLLKFDIEKYSQFLIYNRPVNPQFSSFIFFIYLHVLSSVVREKKGNMIVWSGVILGISAYIYFYLFTFLLTLQCLMILYYLIRKDKVCLYIFMSLLLGMVLSSYMFYQMYLLISHPLYIDYAKIMDLKNSHHYIISSAGLLITALFIISNYKKIKESEPFIVLIVLASWIVINQQIITGKLLQSGHYHWYYNTPIYIFVLLLILFKYRENKFIKLLPVFFMLISVWTGSFINYSAYIRSIDFTMYQQRYVPAIEWIDNNFEPESVVVANQDISTIVPVISRQNVLWEDHAIYYLLPVERTKITPDFVFRSKDPIATLKKYKVSSIVYDKTKDLDWGIDKYKFKILKDFGTIVVYGI